jgi:uncharacterized protein
MNELASDLNEKYEKLKSAISEKTKIIVAYSGGVDSALLVKISKDLLGDSAWAVLVDSETVSKSELDSATDLARTLGINYEIIRIEQLTDADFIKNDTQRCYYCRKKMAEQLRSFAQEKGITTIAAGAQASDLTDYRPGIKAFNESEIWHPFIDFGFTKDDIRVLAQYLGLPISNKPSMACLSSRIPYGQKITKDNLELVEGAEEYLRSLGFTQFRARINDKTLRIEVIPGEIDRLMELRERIIKRMKEFGIVYITVDLEGFRSGSMNEVLNDYK